MTNALRAGSRSASRAGSAGLFVGCILALLLLTQTVFATSTGRVSGEYIPSLFWSSAQDMAVSGHHACRAMELGLAVIDLSDPAHPRWEADYYLGAAGHIVLTDQDRVYLVHYGSLFIFDVSNPAEPVLLCQFPVGGTLRAMTVSGGILVAGD